MQMNIQCCGFDLTPGLRDYTKKRLAYILRFGSAYIMRLTVRLSDVNGPRGGEDKRCCIELRLKGLSDVVIEDTETDLYAAIDRAAERAARTLARRLTRSRRRQAGIRLAFMGEPPGHANLHEIGV